MPLLHTKTSIKLSTSRFNASSGTKWSAVRSLSPQEVQRWEQKSKRMAARHLVVIFSAARWGHNGVMKRRTIEKRPWCLGVAATRWLLLVGKCPVCLLWQRCQQNLLTWSLKTSVHPVHTSPCTLRGQQRRLHYCIELYLLCESRTQWKNYPNEMLIRCIGVFTLICEIVAVRYKKTQKKSLAHPGFNQKNIWHVHVILLAMLYLINTEIQQLQVIAIWNRLCVVSSHGRRSKGYKLNCHWLSFF